MISFGTLKHMDACLFAKDEITRFTKTQLVQDEFPFRVIVRFLMFLPVRSVGNLECRNRNGRNSSGRRLDDDCGERCRR